MSAPPGKKDHKGCVAKSPRVLRVNAVGSTYGVAFGTHVYAVVSGAVPLALYRCTKAEAVPFYRKHGGKTEDLHDVTDEDGCALPGEILVADLEKSGWVRFIGGVTERWLPLEGSSLERLERLPEQRAAAPGSDKEATVPPGWEILTWQACQGAVLKTVIASFEWGADAAVVQDTVQARFLRIGTKRSDRPGAVLGDASVSVAADGTLAMGGDAVLITRPMIGVSWGEDMFDVTGLLNDAGYAAAASGAYAVRPAQRELEAEALEAGQQALAAEVRGWFAPTPPSNAELVRVAAREASALRRLWSHDLRERRLLRVYEGLVQIPAPSADSSENDTAEDSSVAAAIAAAAAAEEEFDPVQIWVQVALGSVLELAACIPPQAGQLECIAFERLIARGTKTFASAAPLSLFGAGQMSKLCVTETVAALESLVLSMPALKPAALEMLLTLATVTGSSRLVAQALQWLLAGADEACARRCVPSLSSLWKLGSAMHFETLKVPEAADKRLERKRDLPAWRFVHLTSYERPATSTQRLRSHRTISFEEPLPGGVYWEVTVHASDRKSVILGVWLESKKKPIGCCLGDGSAVGPGAEASPADPLPTAEASGGAAVYGVLATTEDLTVTCDGRPFSRIQYKKLLAVGERVAAFVEHGPGTQVHVNIGQETLQHLPPPPPSTSGEAASAASPPAASSTASAGSSAAAASSLAATAASPSAAPVAAASSDATASTAALAPVAWGRACDPYSECPYRPFTTAPTTSSEVAGLLIRITERNVGRLGSSVDSGTPVQHTFAKSDQMSITEDGTVVNNIRENSWARVDCEITVGVSVEFSFEVLDDRENDEGTCYGISTAECTKYDSRGSFVLRGYSGHLYCDGSDKGEKFPKIHPRNRVSFRFDYSEGRLEAWLDDQEPRMLINDPGLFAGRTLYPTVFNYHGTRTKVKLLRCSSGLRSRAALQDSFALEVTAPAAALWLTILEQILAPVRGSEPGSPEAHAASGPAATVLKVLLATANVSPSIWVEFGAIRGRIMDMIEFVVIERRNDPALQQPRDIGILLISVLGVGALFGGPEQVLKVFLSIRDSEASRLGQTLVAYLLGTRRSAPVAPCYVLGLSRLAVSDELGCQILLRLALNAFMDGVEKLKGIACGVLELVGELESQLVIGDGAPSFVSELLPVLAQLLAALPRREPAKLLALLELLRPAAGALTCIRRAMAGSEPLRFITDTLQGLNAFICGVAGLLLAPGELPPFPLDIGDAELRDTAADPVLPKVLVVAEDVVDEIAGKETCPRSEGVPLPDLVSEILGATGRGEALVSELHQKSPFSKQPVNPVQRVAFAAAVLCTGPDMWDSMRDDPSAATARGAWQAAQVFTNNKVRPMKHSIAANEGDANTFEVALADQLGWVVRNVTWSDDVAAPAPLPLARSATAPETRSQRSSRMPMLERMRHLGRMNALEGHKPPEGRHDLSKAHSQLVNGVATIEALVTSASAHRNAAVGRWLGLRLLRFLVRGSVAAEGVQPLLPSLHAALEETLAHPLAGLAYGGVSSKQAALSELAALLREVHSHCTGSTSPTAAALSLAMMSVPLSRDDLEPLLGSLLSSLPTLALDSSGGGGGGSGVSHCRAHAAQLVLRLYISGRGRIGPALAALLGQIAASLDTMLASPTPASEPPLPLDSCTDPLEIDWDFGAFGRLCSRKLDTKALCETLAPPSDARGGLCGAEFEQGPALALTLKELRKHRASGVLPPGAAASLFLRLPQGAREEAAVDPVEVLQVLRSCHGEVLPWPNDRRPGSCATALTLLRPAAELLPMEVPGFVERLLKVVSHSSTQRLPASLAVCLYFKLQLPDEQLAADAPKLLALLGEVGRLADCAPPKSRGTVAFSTLLARQLTSRARAMTESVLSALEPASGVAGVDDASPLGGSGAQAALDLVGGPPRCAACQMQVLGTLFGRSLVVSADSQHVAVLSLDGAADAKAVQWVQWGDLQVPPREVSVVAGVGRASLWGEKVVNRLLAAVQRLLAGGRGRERIPPELLRALAAVLPAAPRWDVTIVTEVVRELDELAAAGVNDLSSSPLELLEHRCTLLRLALWQERGRNSSTQPGAEAAGASDETALSPHNATASSEPSALALPSTTLPGGAGAGLPAVGSGSSGGAEAPSVLGVLSQGAEWRGRYKLKRHTNTWYKLKWHMELRLAFHAGGALDAVARWPKFSQPCNGRNAKWRLEEGGGVYVEFDVELPGGRREGGRTRDCEIFTWKGRLVQSRGCPHFEGTATGRSTELRYEWYVVPPDPLALLRAADLDLFGKPDEVLPRPFSLLGFNTGFIEQKAEHFSTTLGLSNFTKADGTARDLAMAAVKQLPRYQYINGPKEVAKVAKQSPEESWGMRDSLEEDEGTMGGPIALEERWCSVGEILGEDGSGARPALEIAAALEREERQLRLAVLMRILQVMLAHRPASAAIADCFQQAAAREAFFRRALRLPDAGVVLSRCTEDFSTSPEVAQSALTVAVEGLLTPFMAGGVSTLTVESDHDYHPNEDWVFKLSIPGASRMKLKFDSRCKTENGRDFLQFFGERDLQGNFSRRLHGEDKLCGQYPTGFPDLHVPGDNAWLRFQSDGSEQFWGFKFTLSGEGGGSGAAAVPFPAALKLLVATACAVPEADRSAVRLMGASVLLSVSAAQPLSDEATRAAEALCELLPEPSQWSDNSWSAALSLMSVAERNGRRQLLASLVTLLSTQMGPYAALGNHTAPALLLDRMQPVTGGVLLNGRTTLVAGSSGRTHALGLPVPLTARAGHALFCVRVEPASGRGTPGSSLGIGVALPREEPADDPLEAAIFCDATGIALPGEDLSVEVQRHGAAVGSGVVRLLVTGRHGTVHAELPAEWRHAATLLPALWAEGFGTALTLRPPPGASHDSEAAASRLEQLQRTSRLVEACRGSKNTPLPAALVAGAWARREGGDEADVAAVQERLRARCVAFAESEHPHAWGVVTQKLEVPGASALELTFPRVELTEGYRLRVTHDAAGELMVMKPCVASTDGGIQHSVEFGKYLFATLDDADPNSRDKGQQEGWFKTPPGWELVLGQADVVREVVAKYHWATEVIVVGSGDAFYTLTYEQGSKAGQSAGKDKLSSRGADSRAEYQPNRIHGRVLVRRLRPDAAGQCHATQLVPEELAPGERVIVPCNSVYIHGPVPSLPRWDPVLSDDGGDALDPDVASTPARAALKPILCSGPWVWSLSPTHCVEVALAPDGSVRLVRTSMTTMTCEELDEAKSAMAACGEAVIQADASWVDPAKFRLARVSGSWDAEARAALKLELEGVDDLGTAVLAFSSSSPPETEGGHVVVTGEISHTRWGRHRVSFEGRASLAGKVASTWRMPESGDPAVEVQILGRADPATATSVRVLTASAATALPEQGAEEAPAEDAPQLALILSEGEYVERVLVENGGGGTAVNSQPTRIEVCTSRDRRLSWPPSPSDGANGGAGGAGGDGDGSPAAAPQPALRSEHRAAEYCEIMRFVAQEATSGGESQQLLCRPLALGRLNHFEMPQQLVPEGVWEGTYQVDGQRPQAVRCRVSRTGPVGQFSTSLEALSGHSGGASPSTTATASSPAELGDLINGKLHGSCSARADLIPLDPATGALSDNRTDFMPLDGRFAIDSDRRACLLLAYGDAFLRTPRRADDVGGVCHGARVALRSRARAPVAEQRPLGACGVPTIDGPSLVFNGVGPTPRYVMHTAKAPWTQQIASDYLVAELMVQQLSSSGGSAGGGLVIGVADPRPGGGVEALPSWPGEGPGRWLWRSDGAIAHGAALEQRSRLWGFGAGDSVGFAVGRCHVSFLRNGERVHTVPRSTRGEAEPLGRGAAPVLLVGLSSDAVVRLCEGAQHLHLCEDPCSRRSLAETRRSASPQAADADGRDAITDSSPRGSDAALHMFRKCVWAVVWLARLVKATFAGPPAWGQPPAPGSSSMSIVAAAPASNDREEPDIWVEATFTGTMPCFSKGRTLVEEIGGEQVIKELIAGYYRSQNRPDDDFIDAEAENIQELFVNELGPMDGDRFTSARVSARLRAGHVERFRQVTLERDDECWKIVELLGDGSGKRGLCTGPQRLPPGAELVAVSVDDGWLQVAAKGDERRPLWYPIKDDAGVTRFVRKKDFTVKEVPLLAHATTRHFSGPSSSKRDAEPVGDGEAAAAELPGGSEPYTVEACIRVPHEESNREMCVVAWGDDRGPIDHGLALHDVVASASCSLKGTKKVCDGVWHHVACTFDGRERRLWVDNQLIAHDVPELCRNASATRRDNLSIGKFPTGFGEVRIARGGFRGDMKRLRIWRVALTPAAMKAYAATAEAKVREEITIEAVKAVFKGVDQRGDARLSIEDLDAVFGSARNSFFERLDGDAKGYVSCDDWLRFCCGLKEARGEQDLMQFLQACARNLGQRRRPLQVQDDWEHPRELLAELSLASNAYGWRVEAKPVSLSDDMLERIEDEGLERFRRQVRVAHALLGQSADEAIVELADRAALQQGNHDDCWAKMLAVADWSQAQPRWMEQAVASAKLEDLSTSSKLQEVLAWASASGTTLGEALEAPLSTLVMESPRVEELRLAAEQAGGTSEAWAGLANELLTSPAAAAAVDAMFREVVGHMLFTRFLILLELNWSVSRDFLPLIDLAAPADSAYGRLLAQVKPRLLGHLKFSQFQHVLQSTKYEGSTPSIILNRKAALTLRERGRVDWEFRRSLIGQFLSEMRKQQGGPKLFRRPWQSRCMKVQFKGEGGEDAGGLYREALDAVAQELHSKSVPLFVPCPNAVAEVGDNRDAWLLNPRATTPECVRALEFVGQLLGLALRTGDLLPLTLAPFTWKGIVGDERKRDDVRSIDVFAEKHLSILSSEERPDEETLSAMGGLQFAYPDVTGEEAELIEGGREIGVTPENASEFARLLLQNRLQFDRFQLQALRRGLATVVPIQLIRLWSWRDLQERVCGVPEVDLENLKRHTTYKNCTNTNVHVGYMWEALESFTQKQRRSFLRFVWGRSSLPTVEKWERNFTVQLLSGTDDSRLPCSHTCFFTLDLPTFSSSEICCSKLLYCITHCLAIDADGAAARSLNWDEDDED